MRVASVFSSNSWQEGRGKPLQHTHTHHKIHKHPYTPHTHAVLLRTLNIKWEFNTKENMLNKMKTILII